MDSKQICKGCLSADRTLSAVRDDLKKLFYDVLFDVEDKSHQLQLCWECTAIMNKFLRFKLQVRWAQKCLAKCMVHHIAVTSLSRLTITNHNLTVINDNTNEDTINDKLPIDFIKTEDNILHHSEYNDLDNESHSEYPDNVEYNEFEYNQAHNNISDLKHDIVEDEILPRIPESKVRKKQRSKTKEIFNESDDEPLKQQNDDVKPRSKRKARDVTKSDRRKIEKPAGVVTNARVTKKLEQLNVGSDHLEMVLLSWEEVEVERRAALANVTFTRHESRCESCIIGFNHRSKLVEHMKKHDIFITKSRRDMSYELHQVRKIDGGHQCDVCQVWCKDGRSLTAHRRRHRLRWRCRACGGAWSRAANAADHTARAHGAPPPTHTCALCGYTAATLGKLRNHIRTHAERQKCDLCGKSFRDRASLRTHLFIHNGEKNYSCPRCDKRFLFKSAMEIHLETHNASAQLYCLQCDMNFKNRMSYNQHMRYNLKHIDPAKLKYACDACDKKFVKASRLQEHKLAVHLKLTPISCTIPGCQFSCSSRPVLRTHIRMQHRDGRDRRNHVCHICGKAYASKNSLEGHLRAHTGERPLRCPRCPASFGYDAALYNHVKHVHLKHKVGMEPETPLP